MNRTAAIASLLVACASAAAQLDHPPPGADPSAPRPPAPAKAPAVTPAQPQAEQPKAAKRDPIYDENADARAQIAAAVARAKKEHRRVLIQWGGNWCSWCHLLHNTLSTDRALKKELNYEYDVVLVDAGGRDQKNMDLAEKLGAKIDGFPYLTILDGDGKPIAQQGTEPLELKGSNGESLLGAEAGHDPAKVLEFLKKHEAPRVEAVAEFKSGVEEARTSNRLVFLHFGAPWCGWCHRLEDWMARKDISPLLAKDFVDVKIDQDRMPGASELFERYCSKPGGIPWFAIVDPETGRAVITSDGPKGNVGFPAAPEEIEHFVAMLKKTARKLTEADIKAIEASLQPTPSPGT